MYGQVTGCSVVAAKRGRLPLGLQLDSARIHGQALYGGSPECCCHACGGCCCDVHAPLDRPLSDRRTSHMTKPTTPRKHSDKHGQYDEQN